MGPFVRNASMSQDPGAGLVSDSDYAIADGIISPTLLVLSICGMATNWMNIGTFLSMGIKDGVTLSFMILSCADFCFALINIFGATGRFLVYLEREHNFASPISPFVLVTIGHFVAPFASVVCIATAFIASIRCACVVSPLKFKNMFTKLQTGAFLGGCTLMLVGIVLPLMMGYQFVYAWDEGQNVSRVVVVETADNQDLQTAIWLFANTIVPVAAQVIVMACVPVLIHTLKAASSFREQSQASTINDEKGTKGRLDSKDTQVVAQVVFISVVFVTCNFFVIVYCIVARVETEFYYGKRYNNLHGIVQNLVSMGLLTSGFLNIFVYLKYNSSYRGHFILKRLSL